MGRQSRPALGVLAGVLACAGVAVTTTGALAQSGPPAAMTAPGGAQGEASTVAPGTGSAGPAQPEGQPPGSDRQGSAGPDDGRPVPGCPARRNKLDLIV